MTLPEALIVGVLLLPLWPVPTSRVTHVGSHEYVVHASDDWVSLSKRVGPTGSVTTIVVPGDVVTIAIEGTRMLITFGRSRAVEVRADTLSAERAIGLMQWSAAVQAGRVLLGRMVLRPDSIGGHALFLTRTMLDAVRGEADEVNAYERWATNGRHFQIALDRDDGRAMRGCVDAHRRRLTERARDRHLCRSHAPWGVPWRAESCELIYGIAAEAAFIEWLGCPGGDGF